MHELYDVAIIGAGITGSAIARQLSRHDLRVVLIDGADDVAMGASRANSAIVHAGYDCPPGSLEAELNVRGNELMTRWCRELGVPLQRCGSLVIGFDDVDKQKLVELYERGEQNQVPRMRILTGDEARDIEPALSPDVKWALLAETGGITCPYQLTIACAEHARANGCEWVLGDKVERIVRTDGALTVYAGARTLRARYVVNAAGLYADNVARMVGDDSFLVRPRKGEYLLLDRTATLVKTVIFQTPSALGKGILVSPTVDGNCFAGPTAVDMDDKADNCVTSEGIRQLIAMSHRSVPSLNFRAVITSFAGVRAQPSTGDFIIRVCEAEPRMVHAAGICSPGLTSAPAIAERIERLLTEMGLALKPKPNYEAARHAIPAFRDMSADQRRAAIAKNPGYSRVICRCETVTEAEIVEAIRRGARSVDGVKRRTRAGMGRCQGGFCGPRVMEILARELGISLDKVNKSGAGSWMVLPLEGDERT